MVLTEGSENPGHVTECIEELDLVWEQDVLDVGYVEETHWRGGQFVGSRESGNLQRLRDKIFFHGLDGPTI